MSHVHRCQEANCAHCVQGVIWMPKTCQDLTAHWLSVRQDRPSWAATTCCLNTEWLSISDKARRQAAIDMLACIAPRDVLIKYQAWLAKGKLPKSWLHAERGCWVAVQQHSAAHITLCCLTLSLSSALFCWSSVSKAP